MPHTTHVTDQALTTAADQAAAAIHHVMSIALRYAAQNAKEQCPHVHTLIYERPDHAWATVQFRQAACSRHDQDCPAEIHLATWSRLAAAAHLDSGHLVCMPDLLSPLDSGPDGADRYAHQIP